MPFPALPLHEKITYQFPMEGIDEIGAKELNRYLDSTFGAVLPADWNYDWVVHRGAISGTFPRRVTTWLYKSWNIKATPEQVSELGNIASRHTIRQIPYLFDIDDSLDWARGAFGDDGSCYWSSRASARIMLRRNNCRAIRFYKVDKPMQGYGRAWIADLTRGAVLYDKTHTMLPNQGELQANCIGVFNGYGFHTGALQPARILAGYLGLSYKQVVLRNEGEQGGMMWINEEGRGYIVGPVADIDRVDFVDLQYAEIENVCTVCGKEIGDDFDDEESYVAGGRLMCVSCFRHAGFLCQRCGNPTLNERGCNVTISTRAGATRYCGECVRYLNLVFCDGLEGTHEHWVLPTTQVHLSRLGLSQYCHQCVTLATQHGLCDLCRQVVDSTSLVEQSDHAHHCLACVEVTRIIQETRAREAVAT